MFPIPVRWSGTQLEPHVHKAEPYISITMLQPKAPWIIYATTPIKLVSFSQKVLEFNDNVWSVTENYKAANDEEISLKKGQLVEVLVKPHGSSRWRVRLLLTEGVNPTEGWAPHNNLKRSEERDPRKKRHSDISQSSSEGQCQNTKLETSCDVLYPSVNRPTFHCLLRAIGISLLKESKLRSFCNFILENYTEKVNGTTFKYCYVCFCIVMNRLQDFLHRTTNMSDFARIRVTKACLTNGLYFFRVKTERKLQICTE